VTTRITKNTNEPWPPTLRQGRPDDEDEDEHEVAADDLLAARTRREKLQKQDAHPETVAEARREEEAAEHAYRRTLVGFHGQAAAAEDEEEEEGGGESEVSKALSGLYTNAVDLTVQKSQDSELVSGICDRRQRLSKRHLAQFDSAYADPSARAQIEQIRKQELGLGGR
jgi:hypothetical protein